MSTIPISQNPGPRVASEAAWAELLLALERTQKCLERQFSELAECQGLTLAEALALVGAGSLAGLCQQRELGDRLGCSPGHVSGVVERLRARGLLAAERLPRDRRRQCWQLTEAGRNCLAALWQAWDARRWATGDLSTNRLIDLARRLDELRGASDPRPAAAGGAAA